MRKFLCLSIFTILVSCQPLNISSKNSNVVGDCSKNVFVKYRKSSKNHMMVADKSKQTITVFLESYLSGNVQGYIGDELIFSDNVVTEESLGTTGKYFTYDYSKNSSLAKIKILTEDDCLEINIEKKYKLVYIYNYEGKWDVIYSNIYPTYE
ncbi:hypothetical protein [Empedobacter stercoris]|uniref:Lipoprotein n=1 Tax=Empedobacter stercoris TaxID=1628248 RepID=A0ABX1WLG8_9FLAO|nr:hypothetical protein [Empedobacter stercoris]NOJ75343.1 hypothetical protein [Empedobacter stercoris]